MKVRRVKTGSQSPCKLCAMLGSHTQTECGLLHIPMHHKLAIELRSATVYVTDIAIGNKATSGHSWLAITHRH